jgi:hypothetical protein
MPLFDQPAIIQTQTPPLRMQPHAAPNRVLDVEQSAIAGVDVRRKLDRIAVFDNARPLDYQYAFEILRIADVVDDAE